MAKNNFTPSEFAKCLGKTAQWVHMYTRRGRIKRKGKYIDVSDPVNERLLREQKEKGNAFDVTKLSSNGKKYNSQKPQHERNPVLEQKTEIDEDSVADIDKRKKQVELEKIRWQARNEEIKAAKNEGKLIPIDEVSTLLVFVVENFHSHYLQEVDSMLHTIAGNMDISHERFVEIRKQLKNMLNSQFNEARKQCFDGIENLANEYSEVRGKGEHK